MPDQYGVDSQQGGTTQEDWDYFKSPDFANKPLPEKLVDFNNIAGRSQTYATMSWDQREKLRRKVLGVNESVDVFKHEKFQTLDPEIQNNLFDSVVAGSPKWESLDVTKKEKARSKWVPSFKRQAIANTLQRGIERQNTMPGVDIQMPESIAPPGPQTQDEVDRALYYTTIGRSLDEYGNIHIPRRGKEPLAVPAWTMGDPKLSAADQEAKGEQFIKNLADPEATRWWEFAKRERKLRGAGPIQFTEQDLGLLDRAGKAFTTGLTQVAAAIPSTASLVHAAKGQTGQAMIEAEQARQIRGVMAEGGYQPTEFKVSDLWKDPKKAGLAAFEQSLVTVPTIGAAIGAGALTGGMGVASPFIGSAIAGASLEIPMIYQDIYETTGELTPVRSAAFGMIAGAMEGLGSGTVAKQLVRAGVSTRVISKATAKTLSKIAPGESVAKEIIKGVKWNMVQEGLQSWPEDLAVEISKDQDIPLADSRSLVQKAIDFSVQEIPRSAASALIGGIVGGTGSALAAAAGAAGPQPMPITAEDVDFAVRAAMQPGGPGQVITPTEEFGDVRAPQFPTEVLGPAAMERGRELLAGAQEQANQQLNEQAAAALEAETAAYRERARERGAEPIEVSLNERMNALPDAVQARVRTRTEQIANEARARAVAEFGEERVTKEVEDTILRQAWQRALDEQPAVQETPTLLGPTGRPLAPVQGPPQRIIEPGIDQAAREELIAAQQRMEAARAGAAVQEKIEIARARRALPPRITITSASPSAESEEMANQILDKLNRDDTLALGLSDMQVLSDQYGDALQQYLSLHQERQNRAADIRTRLNGLIDEIGRTKPGSKRNTQIQQQIDNLQETEIVESLQETEEEARARERVQTIEDAHAHIMDRVTPDMTPQLSATLDRIAQGSLRWAGRVFEQNGMRVQSQLANQAAANPELARSMPEGMVDGLVDSARAVAHQANVRQERLANPRKLKNSQWRDLAREAQTLDEVELLREEYMLAPKRGQQGKYDSKLLDFFHERWVTLHRRLTEAVNTVYGEETTPETRTEQRAELPSEEAAAAVEEVVQPEQETKAAEEGAPPAPTVPTPTPEPVVPAVTAPAAPGVVPPTDFSAITPPPGAPRPGKRARRKANRARSFWERKLNSVKTVEDLEGLRDQMPTHLPPDQAQRMFDARMATITTATPAETPAPPPPRRRPRAEAPAPAPPVEEAAPPAVETVGEEVPEPPPRKARRRRRAAPPPKVETVAPATPPPKPPPKPRGKVSRRFVRAIENAETEDKLANVMTVYLMKVPQDKWDEGVVDAYHRKAEKLKYDTRYGRIGPIEEGQPFAEPLNPAKIRGLEIAGRVTTARKAPTPGPTPPKAAAIPLDRTVPPRPALEKRFKELQDGLDKLMGMVEKVNLMLNGTSVPNSTQKLSTKQALHDLSRVGFSKVRQVIAARNKAAKLLDRSLVEDGGVFLIGQSLPAKGDVLRATKLAQFAQILRDNRWETSRIFFVDENGLIMDHTAVSLRLPGTVSVFAEPSEKVIGRRILEKLADLDKRQASGEAIPFIEFLDAQLGTRAEQYNIARDRFLREIKSRAERIGAKGIYFLHNHPNSEQSNIASIADIENTAQMAKAFGDLYLGHVVINDRVGTYIPPDVAKRANVTNINDPSTDEEQRLMDKTYNYDLRGEVERVPAKEGARPQFGLAIEGLTIPPPIHNANEITDQDEMLAYYLERGRALGEIAKELELDSKGDNHIWVVFTKYVGLAERGIGRPNEETMWAVPFTRDAFSAKKRFGMVENEYGAMGYGELRETQDKAAADTIRGLMRGLGAHGAIAVGNLASKDNIDAVHAMMESGALTDFYFHELEGIGEVDLQPDDLTAQGLIVPDRSARAGVREQKAVTRLRAAGGGTQRPPITGAGWATRGAGGGQATAPPTAPTAPAQPPTPRRGFDDLPQLPAVGADRTLKDRFISRIFRKGPQGWESPLRAKIMSKLREQFNIYGGDIQKGVARILEEREYQRESARLASRTMQARITNVINNLSDQGYDESRVRHAIKMVTEGTMTPGELAARLNVPTSHPLIQMLQRIHQNHLDWQHLIANWKGMTPELKQAIQEDLYYQTRFYQRWLLGDYFIPNEADFQRARQVMEDDLVKEIEGVMRTAGDLTGIRQPIDVAAYLETGDDAILAPLAPSRQDRLRSLRNHYLQLADLVESIQRGPNGTYQAIIDLGEIHDVALKAVNSYLQIEPEGPETTSGVGTANFIHRKLTEAFRKLYGEVEDPAMREPATIEVQKNILANMVMMQKLFDEGRDAGWYADRRSGKYSVQLGSERNSRDKLRYGPMAGKWVTPGMAKALESKVPKSGGWAKLASTVWLGPQAGMRALKLLWLKTIGRNALTSLFGQAMNTGDIYYKPFWGHLMDGMHIAWKANPLANIGPDITARGFRPGQKNVWAMEKVAEAAEKGYYSHRAQSLTQGVKALIESPLFTPFGLTGKLKNFLQRAMEAYALIDFPVKYAAYQLHRQLYIEAGVPVPKAEAAARDWVRDHYQNRHRGPKVLDTASQAGFADYVGYTYDSGRMLANSAKTAVTHAFVGDPVMPDRAKNIRPLLGFVSARLLPMAALGGGNWLYATAFRPLLTNAWAEFAQKTEGAGKIADEILGYFFPHDDDEKEKKVVKRTPLSPQELAAFRKFMPDFDANMTVLAWKTEYEDGTFDISYTAMNGNTWSPIEEWIIGALQNSMEGGKPFWKALLGNITENLGPGMYFEELWQAGTGQDPAFDVDRVGVGELLVSRLAGHPKKDEWKIGGERLGHFFLNTMTGQLGPTIQYTYDYVKRQKAGQKAQIGSMVAPKSLHDVRQKFTRFIRTYHYDKDDLARLLTYQVGPYAEDIHADKYKAGTQRRAEVERGVATQDDIADSIAGRKELARDQMKVHELVRAFKTLPATNEIDDRRLALTLQAAGAKKRAPFSTEEAMAIVTGKFDRLKPWESEVKPTYVGTGEDVAVKYMQENWGHISYSTLQKLLVDQGYQVEPDIKKFREWAKDKYRKWQKVEETFE